MNVLDLFSGLGGWNRAFKDRGHKVVSIDVNPVFNPTISADIMGISSLDDLGSFDVVLASPPCQCFSLASAAHYWKDGVPVSKDTLKAIDLVRHTIKLIEGIDPMFWFLENPRGMLRKILGVPPVTLFYCQYGEDRLKPTDIWGVFPSGFVEAQDLDRKKFSYSPTGTYDINCPELRAKVPYGLSELVCKLCEAGL